MTAIDIIRKAQTILGKYLPPDGITQDECINQLLTLLDGSEAVALTWEDSRGSIEAVRQLNDPTAEVDAGPFVDRLSVGAEVAVLA